MRRMNALALNASPSNSSSSPSSSDTSLVPSELEEVDSKPRVEKVVRLSRSDRAPSRTTNLKPLQPEVDTSEIISLRARVEQLEQDRDRMIDQKVKEKEMDIRRNMALELGKSEAAWKERVRNERLVRLSYERVLLSLGFAPNRIASDIVRVSRPQPFHEDPATYGTMNLLNIEAGLVAPPSRQKGLFSYTMEELRSGVSASNVQSSLLPTRTVDEKIEALSLEESFFPLKSNGGKKDLLRTLSSSA